MRFKIILKYKDGHEARLSVEAEDEIKAMDKLENKEVQEYIKSFTRAKIIDVSISLYEEIIECDFVLQTKANGNKLLTDRVTGVSIEYTEGLFNETQKIRFLKEEITEPLTVATILRQAGDFVAKNNSK